MSDLFNELLTATGPSQRMFDREEEAVVQYPKVASVDQMIAVAFEEIGKHMPDAATLARMKGSGWYSTPVNGWSKRPAGVDCHRSYMFTAPTFEFPEEGIVGQQHLIQFREAIHKGLDPNNDGTQAFILQKNQGTGRFVPVEIAHRIIDRPDLVTVPVAQVSGAPEDTYPLDDVIQYGVRPVKRRMVQIMVRWADLANAPELTLNMHGEPVTETTVNVNQTNDPALAKALDRLSEKMDARPTAAPDPTMAAILGRLVDNVTARTAPEVKADPVVAPTPAPEVAEPAPKRNQPKTPRE